MAECENCGMAIEDPDKSIHDGTHWFCDHRCLGQWARKEIDITPPGLV